jgi:hypothetical protein
MISKGILIFAFNNSEIDYVKIAEYAAKRATKFLNLPVSLVTDNKDAVHGSFYFDKIIEIEKDPSTNSKFFYDGIDKNNRFVWHNKSRAGYYDLSPYDETLVIDADYIINSDFLKYCWHQPEDFLIYKDSYDFAQHRENREFKVISNTGPDFYWATVFWFRKTKHTQHFFNLVDHIKTNWKYYKFIYQVHSTNFRNDIAFSIAIHMMNGFVNSKFIKTFPRKLFYILDVDFLLDIKDNKISLLVQKENCHSEYIPVAIENTDVHIMNKYSLLRKINDEQ